MSLCVSKKPHIAIFPAPTAFTRIMATGITTRIIVLLFIVLGIAAPCKAQLGIAAGLEYGTAIFANTPVFVKQPSTGIAVGVAFRPRTSRLYPSLSCLIKTITVPVRSAAFPGLDDFAGMRHFMLKLNYRTTDEPTYTALFFGVGVAHIVPQTSLSDNMGNAIAITDTGSTNLYPAAELGIRRMWKILPNGGFYLGLEGSICYIHMHSQNQYYLQQGATIAAATIGGDVIMPEIALTLHYFFMRNGEAY
jgi:hypothetical protein